MSYEQPPRNLDMSDEEAKKKQEDFERLIKSFQEQVADLPSLKRMEETIREKAALYKKEE